MVATFSLIEVRRISRIGFSSFESSIGTPRYYVIWPVVRACGKSIGLEHKMGHVSDVLRRGVRSTVSNSQDFLAIEYSASLEIIHTCGASDMGRWFRDPSLCDD